MRALALMVIVVLAMCLSGCSINQYIKDNRLFGGLLPDMTGPQFHCAPGPSGPNF